MRSDSPFGDDLVRLADVPKLTWLPTRRAGKRLDISTIFRWAQRGVGGRRLKTTRVGGALCTTPDWLRQFFDSGAEPSAPTTPAPTPCQRRRAIERAERELDAAGI